MRDRDPSTIAPILPVVFLFSGGMPCRAVGGDDKPKPRRVRVRLSTGGTPVAPGGPLSSCGCGLVSTY